MRRHQSKCKSSWPLSAEGSGLFRRKAPDQAARDHKTDEDDGHDDFEGELTRVDAWMAGQIEEIGEPRNVV